MSGALLIGVLAIYGAILRGRIEVYDTEAMLSVTKNLVSHGSLATAGSGWILGPASTPYSPYGIAVSLLAVPAYVLSELTGHFPVLVSLVAPLLIALCVVLIYRIARALGWLALHGVVAALGFGLFSMAIWYTTELFSEPGVTVCVLLIILGLIRWGQGVRVGALWVGLGAGFALQLRSDSLITVWIMLLTTPLFVPRSELTIKRSLAGVMGPMVASVAALCWYNEVRYHKLVVSSYGSVGGFDTPLWHGLRGLLLSPGRSIFVFNPVTVLGVFGLLLLLVGRSVRHRALATVCLLAVVPRTIFFAKWGVWDAGDVWGPRFLLPSVAVLSLSVIPVFQATDSRRLVGVLVRTASVLLTIAAGLINFLSVRMPLGEWIGVSSSPAWQAQLGLARLQGAALGVAADFDLRSSPIWGNAVLLEHHIAIAGPDLWASGHPALGFLLLGAGAVSLTGALWGASGTPAVGHRLQDDRTLSRWPG